MDLEQTHQSSSTSCSNPEVEPESGPSESLVDTVGNPEQPDGSSNTTALTVGTQQDNGSQTASLDDAPTDATNKGTDQELTDSLENYSQSVDGRPENLGNDSENALTPNMLDSGGSADIEPRSSISHMSPSESLLGEHSPAVKFTAEVCTSTDMHSEEEISPSLDEPSDALADVNDFDVPSSSPPVSSPLTFRSSSPIPTASSPCGYDLTPPTSPVKISDASAELANIQIDEFKEVSNVEQLEIIFGRPEIDSEEIVSGHDENVTATVTSKYEPTTSSSMSLEKSLPVFSKNQDDAHLTDHGITPRDKVHQRLIPGPKRATLAAQKVRLQKLSKPFRPPAVQKPIVKQENTTPSGHDNAAHKPAGHTSLFSQKVQEKMKHRTAKAAAQFKSPLASSSTAGEEGRLVRPTATIQALERTLQLLKRAVKVKEESEEEVLSGLIQKWTEAGKEIAWEVWGLVKENEDSAGSKRPMEDSWGWQGAGDSKRQKTEERLWGWDVIPVSEREAEQEECEAEEGARRTMGTMLMEMGIAPETFGWNAEEERFV